MNEFELLLAYLKISYNNLTTLHRNLWDDTSWFGTHEQIEEWYEMFADMVDDLSETALSLGYSEPSIYNAVIAYQRDVLPTVHRGTEETLRLCAEMMRKAAGLMQAAEAIVPASTASHLQDLEYKLNKEASYKIAHAIGGMATNGRFEIEDED